MGNVPEFRFCKSNDAISETDSNIAREKDDARDGANFDGNLALPA